MKTLAEIKETKEQMTNDLINDCGMFFAFSKEQFQESKTPLKEGEKYVSLGAGSYLPKGNIDKFLDGNKKVSIFYKNEIKKAKLQKQEIIYELNNHECYHTFDLTDVFLLFDGTYTKEEIINVFKNNRN